MVLDNRVDHTAAKGGSHGIRTRCSPQTLSGGHAEAQARARGGHGRKAALAGMPGLCEETM